MNCDKCYATVVDSQTKNLRQCKNYISENQKCPRHKYYTKCPIELCNSLTKNNSLCFMHINEAPPNLQTLYDNNELIIYNDSYKMTYDIAQDTLINTELLNIETSNVNQINQKPILFTLLKTGLERDLLKNKLAKIEKTINEDTLSEEQLNETKDKLKENLDKANDPNISEEDIINTYQEMFNQLFI